MNNAIKIKQHVKMNKAMKITFIIVSIVFIIYAISLIYPFIWMLINSFKSNGEYLDNPYLLPQNWKFSNYSDAFKSLRIPGTRVTLIGMFINGFLLAVLGTAYSLILSACSSYVIAKFRFRGKDIIYAVAIFSMIVPVVGALPAQAKLVNTLGLKNNIFLVAILYASGFGFNFLILYGSFKSVSQEYSEAAMIDGCGQFKTFLHIIIPIVKPSLFAVGLIQFIGVWNDYMTPMLYLEKMPTISYAIYVFKEMMDYSGANHTAYFAAVVMATIPILVIFIAFQNTIMENTVAGGLKG